MAAQTARDLCQGSAPSAQPPYGKGPVKTDSFLRPGRNRVTHVSCEDPVTLPNPSGMYVHHGAHSLSGKYCSLQSVQAHRAPQYCRHKEAAASPHSSVCDYT